MSHDYPTKLEERLSQYTLNSCAHSRNMYLRGCNVKGLMLREDESRNTQAGATLRSIRLYEGNQINEHLESTGYTKINATNSSISQDKRQGHWLCFEVWRGDT